MGGAHHPLLGVLGVMSAKNTAMNVVLLTTFLSFVLYRRANKQRQAPRPAAVSARRCSSPSSPCSPFSIAA